MATAVVITDNRPEGYLPIMADDGTGGSIYVPSVFISQADGNDCKAVIAATPLGRVLAQVGWDIPQTTTTVNWTWFMSAASNAGQFKRDFAQVAKNLGNRALVEPHYDFLDGTAWQCNLPGRPCGNQCTNGGRYCQASPQTGSYTGADIVSENLRQYCIFQQVNNTANIDKWWDYIGRFDAECQVKDLFNVGCSQNAVTEAGLSWDQVNACVTNCGGSAAEGGQNKCIDAELGKKDDGNVRIIPTLTIQTRPFTGTLSCPHPVNIGTCTFLKFLCAGYYPDSKPAQCLSSYCWDPKGVDECGKCGGSQIKDDCGVCFNDPTAKNSPVWNRSCQDCLGQKDGKAMFDDCGRCLNPDDPNFVKDKSKGCDLSSVSHGSVIVVSLVVGAIMLGIMGAAGVMFIKQREARMKLQMENVLQRYRPLEEANDFVATARGDGSTYGSDVGVKM
jgi:hypothetical protein